MRDCDNVDRGPSHGVDDGVWEPTDEGASYVQPLWNAWDERIEERASEDSFQRTFNRTFEP